MLAAIKFTVFCLPISYLKTSGLKYIKLQFHLFFLYWCETWSLTLGKENSLRMLKNGMLRRMFGPKREEVTGGCIMRSFTTYMFHQILG